MEPEPKYSVGDRVAPLLMPMTGAIMETELETRIACGSNAGRSQRWFYRVQWPIAHADSDGWYAEDGLALVSSEPDAPGRRLPKSLGMGKNGPADLSEREERAAADIGAFYGGEPAPIPEGVAAMGAGFAFYGAIRDITAWLDESNADIPGDDAMRILKLAEECGEAAEAYIGMMGQNPRKGVTHSKDDLLAELADVAVTALCAMQHFTQNIDETRGVLDSKLESIMCRAGLA